MVAETPSSLRRESDGAQYDDDDDDVLVTRFGITRSLTAIYSKSLLAGDDKRPTMLGDTGSGPAISDGRRGGGGQSATGWFSADTPYGVAGDELFPAHGPCKHSWFGSPRTVD